MEQIQEIYFLQVLQKQIRVDESAQAEAKTHTQRAAHPRHTHAPPTPSTPAYTSIPSARHHIRHRRHTRSPQS